MKQKLIAAVAVVKNFLIANCAGSKTPYFSAIFVMFIAESNIFC